MTALHAVWKADVKPSYGPSPASSDCLVHQVQCLILLICMFSRHFLSSGGQDPSTRSFLRESFSLWTFKCPSLSSKVPNVRLSLWRNPSLGYRICGVCSTNQAGKSQKNNSFFKTDIMHLRPTLHLRCAQAKDKKRGNLWIIFTIWWRGLVSLTFGSFGYFQTVLICLFAK